MKKLFFSFLMASCVFTTTCMANCCPSQGVSRFFIQYRNAAPSTGTADPFHQQMLALGDPNPIYTPADAANLNLEAEAHFLATIGFNFSLSNPNVIYNSTTDVRTLTSAGTPIATFSPFLFGGDGEYNILYDSKSNKKKGNWTVRNASVLVVFLAPGTITEGTAAGQDYVPFNAISYGYADHLRGRPRNWHLKGHWEHFITKGLRPGNLLFNSYVPAMLEVHVPLQYVDCRGNLGYATDNVYGEKIPDPLTITHHVVTFTENGF